jgi:alpha-tubulin suppressor-like RCC1 family protein
MATTATNYNQYQPYTGFFATDPNTGNQQDLGQRYVTKSYLLDAYPNLVPGRTAPGIWSAGQNTYGQLGQGSVVHRSSPIQIGALTNWSQISGGAFHAVALRSDGTIWSWGDNIYGQLGLLNTVHRSSPVQIGTTSTWRYVSAGVWTSFFISTTGNLWACGYNNHGELGDGTVIYKSSPTQIGQLTNWKLVAGGNYQTAAIKTDGTLWAWGQNTYGGLGQGTLIATTVSYSSPAQIGSLATWKQVSAGQFHFLAVQTNNTLWAWGRNNASAGNFGQLGTSDVAHRSSPTQVGSLTNWKLVSAGGYHSHAIKTDGTLWSWGENDAGVLGDITSIHRSSPVQIGQLTNWKFVSGTGQNFMYAIKTDGTLWSCGYNVHGELGDGTLVYKSSPIQIGQLTTWKQAGNGLYHFSGIADGYF